MAAGNGTAGDPEITTAAGLKPPILWRNKDGRHPAASIRLTAISTWMALMRMPRQRLKPKLQLRPGPLAPMPPVHGELLIRQQLAGEPDRDNGFASGNA